MECKELQEKIDLYLDGELSDRDNEQSLEEHFSGCDSCRSLLDKRRSLLASIGALKQVQPEMPPMETYLAQLRAKIEVQQQPKWWQRFTLNWNPAFGYALAGVLAAVILVTGLAYMTGDQTMSIAMPERGSYIEFLELPTEDASASTFVNYQTQTTVVWINGIEVKQPTSTVEGES